MLSLQFFANNENKPAMKIRLYAACVHAAYHECVNVCMQAPTVNPNTTEIRILCIPLPVDFLSSCHMFIDQISTSFYAVLLFFSIAMYHI